MRRLLLWMARNAWLRERIPRLPFVTRALHRFMPGEEVGAALREAVRFRDEGIKTLFTRLGENLVEIVEADAVAEHYLELLDQIHVQGIPGELSVKLTQLGFDLDETRTEEHMGRLVQRAACDGGTVWIDMEGSRYTDRTIALYERLKARHANVGLCLQAYLRRTAADVQRLLLVEPSIRLVKGAYDESATIAYRSRKAVDANYGAIAVALLEAIAAGRRVRIGLGTHDVMLINQIATRATTLALGRDAFEVQMLYGIRVDQQRRLAAEGYPVRDLIAYGPGWYAWYMRRLAERPANVLFALRQIVG
jgi:proline dehydrogenase